MSRLLLILALVFSVSFGMTACGEANENDIDVSELPQSVVTYVTQNYPSASIEEAEKQEDDGQIYYEVELNTGEELLFDATGMYVGTGES